MKVRADDVKQLIDEEKISPEEILYTKSTLGFLANHVRQEVLAEFEDVLINIVRLSVSDAKKLCNLVAKRLEEKRMKR